MLALRLQRWPLAVRLTLTTTALVVLSVLTVTLLSIHREQQLFQQELRQQAVLLLDTIAVAAEDRIYALDTRFLNDVVRNLAQEEIVLGARFYEAQGRIVADAHDPRLTFRRQTDPLGQRLLESDSPMFAWHPDRLLAGKAIVVGRQRLGAISVELSTGPLQAKMDAVRDQGLGLALLAGLAGSVAAFLVGRSITDPLRELTAATQSVAAGDLTRRLAARGGSELATLAGSFNSMTDQLRDLIENLEHRVQERTAELTRANKALKAYAETEKLRALGQMASGIAHDLNQYLGLVAGHAEIALEALDRPGVKKHRLRQSLDIVLRAAFDGGESVKRLQGFARPRQDTAPERIDLGSLLQEVARFTAPRWQETSQEQGRPIGLLVEVQGDTSIDGCAADLREAFTNLVFNAVDALPDGGEIRLAASGSGDEVLVEVSDSGVGMSPKIQARVFEPFFSTKGERGTGLGLSMVFGIMERHNGKITLESQSGSGTTFGFSFPASTSLAPSQDGESEVGPVAARRILAVDDEPALSNMLALMLAPDGHNVVVAASGEEALERLAENSFDLVISDVGMGAGMNGWELAERVRSMYPRIKFCLATGWGATIDSAQAYARGVHGVVGKPYRLADMRRLIAESLTPTVSR
jgi:signal transduction histidine kinase